MEPYLICVRTIRHARASLISTNREGAGLSFNVDVEVRGTTLPNRAHQSLSRTWIETVSGSLATPWIHPSVSERALTCQIQQGLSKLHALVHLRKGATKNQDEACLPSRTRQRKPHSQNLYASKSKNWMLGLWGSSDASNLRGQRWYVSRSSYSFHPLIHSGRMLWTISFTFLVQATQEFHPDLSVPSLPDWMACHGKSSLLRGPVPYTRRLQCINASRSTYFRSCSIPSSSSSPRATVYRHRILQAIEHLYRRIYAPSRCWPDANFVGSPTPTP